ncbi:MAG TPA: hypothetical protein VL049_17990 [Candidatus Dormibacteraeota bacterium]|nr:hypothetical protein [Candidatus Dormibacteraeota bacterium]
MPVHRSRSTLLSAAILVGLFGASSVAGAAPDTAAVTTPAAATTTSAASCGDGLLGKDETCDSCPADCQPSTCKVKGRRKVTVDLAPQSGYETVGAVTVLLGYRKNVLSLPGEKNAPAAKARVKPRHSTAQVFVNDLGYALRVVVSSQQGLPAGPLLDVDLDTCAGAPAAELGDLGCRVESCAQGGGNLYACACSVSLP